MLLFDTIRDMMNNHETKEGFVPVLKVKEVDGSVEKFLFDDVELHDEHEAILIKPRGRREGVRCFHISRLQGVRTGNYPSKSRQVAH